MFRRAASLLDFVPRDGELVEVRGRLGVYEPRGDLQLIVESLQRAGPGALFEQFLQLKARLEAAGPVRPGPQAATAAAAARHRRGHLARRRRAARRRDRAAAPRVPHVRWCWHRRRCRAPQAPAELVARAAALYRAGRRRARWTSILLVRGGGSIEDLWAFNDEQLARTIVQSPVPVVCGVGPRNRLHDCRLLRRPARAHADGCGRAGGAGRETLAGGDWTRQDACACGEPRSAWTARASGWTSPPSRLGRPLSRMAAQQLRLARSRIACATPSRRRLDKDAAAFTGAEAMPCSSALQLQRDAAALDRARVAAGTARPAAGAAAWLCPADRPKRASRSPARAQAHPGQALRATLADGEVASHGDGTGRD